MNFINAEGVKWEVFKTALGLFAEKGYYTVSIRQIALKVNIKPRELHSYYPSKELILEDIITYYSNCRKAYYPDLEKLLQAVETQPPKEILKKTIPQSPSPYYDIMSNCFLVLRKISGINAEAERLIFDDMITAPRHFFKPLLQKMMDLNKIEPIDIDTFMDLITSYFHSSALRVHTDYIIPMPQWLKGIDMLFDLIQEK